MKNRYYIVAFMAMLGLVSSAHAQTTEMKGEKPHLEIRKEIKDARQDIHGQREDMKKEMEEKREMMRQGRLDIKNAPKEDREEMRGALKEKREDFKNDVRNKREEIKTSRKAILDTRFTEMTNRFNTLVSRVESRIAKLKTQNTDTSAAEKSLLEAKTTLGTIQTQITTLKEGDISKNSELAKPIKVDMKKLQNQIETTLSNLKVEKRTVKVQ